MPLEIKYAVVSYSVTMLKDIGWIQLRDNEGDAGYIYFIDSNTDPDLITSQPGGRPHMVTKMSRAMWPVVLDLLRNEKPLYVRGYRTDQGKVTVFFGTTSQEQVGEAEGTRLLRPV
jgi:hypothetical protein